MYCIKKTLNCYNEAMKQRLWVWSILIALWELSAALFNRPVLMPSLLLVFQRFIEQGTSLSVLGHLSASLTRTFIALSLALISAASLALLAHTRPKLQGWFQPLISLSARVPNVTFILLLLVWVSRQNAVLWIVFMIVFPLLYAAFLEGLNQLHPDLKDVLSLYPETWLQRLRLVYVPALRLQLPHQIKQAFSLGFKVAVMAEIIGQVQPGIGYLMHIARVQFDMIDLFATTLWMILLLACVDGLMTWIHKKTA
jgi:NitT/TauT family transport system permease protein